MRRPSLRPRHGFTVLELTISVSILCLLLGSVTVFQQRSQSSTTSLQLRTRAESDVRAALDVIVQELVGVGATQLSPDPTSTSGNDTLTFQKPVSVSNAGAIVWSAGSRLDMAMDSGELDNGLDDDGDGLVDERRLVLTRGIGTASQRSVTLLHGLPELVPGELPNVLDDNGNGVVDERGFNVRRTGDLLTVRLCVQRTAPGTNTVTVSLQTALVLHN